jgi:acetyltransferase-like isoleucine patch superfamily enzyme
MNLVSTPAFQLLQPGVPVKGDWCNFPVPLNMEVGENTVIDSSSCFKKFFSTKQPGLKIGSNVTLQSPALATEENGYIEIGDYCFISGAAIISSIGIVIGSHVFIAGGVTIVDSDFHPVDPAARMQDTIAISAVGNKHQRPSFESLPVKIEDNVWIGFNATILKGVTIGEGSVIEPGAVVLKNVPPRSVVSGNPALIKPLT